MSKASLPYRLPKPNAVRAEQWAVMIGEEPVPLPEALPDWDYHTDVRMRRSLEIDVDAVRSETGLSPEAPLTLTVLWTAKGSNLRGAGARIALCGNGTYEIDFTLPGSDIGGQLLLDTALVLAARQRQARPASPRRAGSVLWSDQASLRLQGDASQFPMALVDFAEASYPSDAGWYLEIENDLEYAAMGSLRLLINERNAALKHAFENAGSPSPTDLAVLGTVYADAARIMLETALRSEEFSDEAEFEDDTLGSVFMELFERLFPDQTIRDIRLRMERTPALFASDLQAAVRIFEGVA